MPQMTTSEYSYHQALLQELDRLNQCCAQRGARLQVLRGFLRETDWQDFILGYPEAEDWFDQDGVPQ